MAQPKTSPTRNFARRGAGAGFFVLLILAQLLDHKGAFARRRPRKRTMGKTFPKRGRARRRSRPPWPQYKPKGYRCVPHRPQAFLMRRNFMKGKSLILGKHERALNYRILNYGAVPGHGQKATTERVKKHLVYTLFFGHRVRMHERVAPALRCVEKEIRRRCRRYPYKPKAVGGYRSRNTYRGGEVSNHFFGLAVDIDPDKNPCCGCVAPWPDNPLCRKDAKTPYERMSMPRCWVRSFARFGFDWLGHDRLEDTMHFEYLGDPRKIER